MKQWFKYIKPYLPYFIIGPVCMIVEVIGEVLMPLYLAEIINGAIYKTLTTEASLWVMVKMMGTALLMMLGGVGGSYFGAKASVNFAADLRAPTPSAAAELVISHHEELFNRLNQAEKSLKQDISLKFAHARTRLDRSCAILSRNTPDRRVLMLKQHIDDLDIRCSRIAEQRLNHVRTRLESMFASLYAQNPQRLLERGYAVVFDPATNKPVTSSNIAPDTLLSLRFADGSVAVKTLEKEL
jgi:exonuclease VII large subunit